MRAEDFSWPRVAARVEDYYGFVVRRLAASGTLPPDFRSAVPQAPPVRAKASSSSEPEDTAPAALESASVSRQTQAE